MKVSTVQSGYSFVVLELLDDTKSKVSGVEDLKAIPSEKKGRYTFEKVTRQLRFEADPMRGEMQTAYVLVTDFNLSFLASHKANNYWDVIDVVAGKNNPGITLEKILTDIDDILSGVKKATLTVDGEKPADASVLSTEELEKEIARRKNKDVGIETKKAELTPAQRGALTRQKNAEMAKQQLEARKSKIVVAQKDIGKESETAPGPIDSIFVTEVGVKQP
ncbi:MAG TPA: hypothetical protein VMV77_09255 [Bacteroidales bacterium]|nr:hypothetical protein [Bacteroidales bacterium]